MESQIFKQRYTAILISKKILGIWVEFWSEYRIFGDDDAEFFHSVRDKYRVKFNGKPFLMRLYYPNDIFEVSKETVKHIL